MSVQVSRRGSGQWAGGSRPSVSGLAGTVSATGIIPAPKSTMNGSFLTIDFENLSQTTKSKRLHKFLNIGDYTVDLPTTKSKLSC